MATNDSEQRTEGRAIESNHAAAAGLCQRPHDVGLICLLQKHLGHRQSHVNIKCTLGNLWLLWPGRSPASPRLGTSERHLLRFGWKCNWLFISLIIFLQKDSSNVCSDANEKMMKSLSNWRLVRTGAWVKADFMPSKAFLASKVHFTYESFFNILFSILIGSAKFGINILRKLIFPRNACNSLMFLG